MDYDGQSECVLNMKQFLFSYEVLRQHMFHFLLGRYTKIIVHVLVFTGPCYNQEPLSSRSTLC